MGNDLIVYTPPSAEEWGQLTQLAEMACKMGMVPEAVRGKPGEVMATMLMGREIGIPPMRSLKDISFWKGRPTMAATLMVDLARRVHKFKTIESTAERVTVQIHRRGEPEPELPVTFTWADAQQAELTGKDNYRHYPKAMLWARAAAMACRRDASECLGGTLYTPEEIESIPDDGPSMTVTWGEPEKPETAVVTSPAPAATASGTTTVAEAAPANDGLGERSRKAAARRAAHDAAGEAAREAAGEVVEDSAAGGFGEEPPAAGGTSELTGAYELPPWLAKDLDRHGKEPEEAREVLVDAGFNFLAGDGLVRFGDIAGGDVGKARKALHDAWAAKAGG